MSEPDLSPTVRESTYAWSSATSDYRDINGIFKAGTVQKEAVAVAAQRPFLLLYERSGVRMQFEFSVRGATAEPGITKLHLCRYLQIDLCSYGNE
jgi:hypothetical protein